MSVGTKNIETGRKVVSSMIVYNFLLCSLLGSILMAILGEERLCKSIKALRRGVVLSYVTLREPKLRSAMWRKLKNWNWEKISVIGLGICVALIMVLAFGGSIPAKDAPPAATTGPAAAETQPAGEAEEADHWIFQGLSFIFSITEGDSRDFRDYSAYHPAAHFAAVLVSVLVPALAAVAAFILLWNYLPHHVPVNSRIWYIFSGLDPNSVRMAKSLHARPGADNNVYIFLRTRRRHVDEMLFDEIQSLNFFLYPRDEARFLCWRRRRRRILRFFFLSENTDENFSRMKEFLDAAGKNSLLIPREVKLPEGSFQHELYLLSETESASLLITRLREQISNSPMAESTFANTELRLLDRFRSVSYDLLRSEPLHRFRRGDKLNVLVLGFGRIGREFFRAAYSLGVMHGCTTSFTLCDTEIKRKLDSFLCQCPELRVLVTFFDENRGENRYTIQKDSKNLVEMELNAESEALTELIKSNEFHYIVIALGDDERNIRVATRLKKYYRKCHWEGASTPQPKICVNIEDSVKHAYVGDLWKVEKEWDPGNKDSGWDLSLHVFGGLDQAFSAEVLMPQKLWLAARQTHKLLNKGKDINWQKWSEYERRSSIACAAHAEYHVDVLRRQYNKDHDGSGQPEDPATWVKEHYLDEYKNWKTSKSADYEKLIDSEHQRWMAYSRSEGMQKVKLSAVEKYHEEVSNHVDILGGFTPCLVDTAGELVTLANDLKKLAPKRYPESWTTFRERDALVVKQAGNILIGLRTGVFPEDEDSAAG